MTKTLYKGIPQRRQALLTRDRRWISKGVDTLSVFGDGADGNVTVTGTVTLTQDALYKNLTVESGGLVETNGYKIFVKDLLTVRGTIRNKGVDATDFTGASEPPGVTVDGARPGNNGGFGNSNGSNGNLNAFRVTIGAPAGKGGDAGAFTGGVGDFGAGFDPNDIEDGRTSAYLYDVARPAATGQDLPKTLSGGHGGGGGASSGGTFGGGGGSGGGVIVISARHVKVGSAGLITAPGGAGGPGSGADSGGGGGGSGGTVIILCDTYSGPDPVSPGGIGGPGVGAGENGQTGGPGEFIRRFRDLKV